MLQSLLAERVSIRDLATILEGIQEACGGAVRAIPSIVAHVRARLARQISDSHTGPGGYIPLVTLSPEWEAEFAEALAGPPEDRQLAMAPSKLQDFMQKLRAAFDAAANTGETAGAADLGRHPQPCAGDRGADTAEPRRCWHRRKSIRGRGSGRWGRYDGRPNAIAMRLKLYRAPAMAQAMARVRAELGEDALILATRRVGDGVEVTAALEPEDEPAPPSCADPARLAALDFHGVPAARCAPPSSKVISRPALAAAISFATLPLGRPAAAAGRPARGRQDTDRRAAGDPPGDGRRPRRW